jgi:energy-coupling factor transporter ATP-binding protein EcfA2
LALASAESLCFSYPGASQPALANASLTVEPGELIVVLGSSGSGKSTLLRAFAGLVPHFHGGRFSGRVEVAGLDTRRYRPAELAGAVATLFQDPEDQVVFAGVAAEVAFGLENVGTPPGEIETRVREALAAVEAEHLSARAIATLSGGELQRVCLASTIALGPKLLLLDEPTSQLDPEMAEVLLDLACRLARERGVAVVVAEQRPAGPLARADRVIVLEAGKIVLDAPRQEAVSWLAEHRPAFLGLRSAAGDRATPGDEVCALDRVAFAYPGGPRVVDGFSLSLRRGEVVALTGPNGTGKTTLEKLTAGLLEPDAGSVKRSGRAGYLAQDPGRYLVRERVDEEVALAVGGDRARARRALGLVGLAGFDARHPRDLSSGERERLALAAVLVSDPDVLVLDEPSRGVDPERKQELAALLRAEAPRRATLVVTHDRELAAAAADRTVSTTEERDLVAL